MVQRTAWAANELSAKVGDKVRFEIPNNFRYNISKRPLLLPFTAGFLTAFLHFKKTGGYDMYSAIYAVVAFIVVLGALAIGGNLKKETLDKKIKIVEVLKGKTSK